MAVYQPNRTAGVQAVLDTVDACLDHRHPKVLDLGGGTGSVGHEVLGRWPDASYSLLDLDPVLTSIAREHLPPHTDLIHADLHDPGWSQHLPHHRYDTVLAVMTVHYLPPERLTQLYAEIRDVLRPGGLLIVLDHMPEPGLATVNARMRHRAGDPPRPSMSWREWWDGVAADPFLGPIVAERAEIMRGQTSAEWNPPAHWHVDTLRASSYGEAGVAWRHGADAAVVAATPNA